MLKEITKEEVLENLRNARLELEKATERTKEMCQLNGFVFHVRKKKDIVLR